MATAGRRRGRRDNGLDAHDWRAVDDLDPRLSEEVLELLRAQGIPAYVQPAMDVDPITRSTTLPDRPRDRLYVDREQSQAARDSLRRFLETSSSSPRSTIDTDATFADIVAGFDQPVDPLRADWPAAESLPPSQPPAPETPGADPSGTDLPATEPPSTEPSRRPGPIDGRHVTEPSLLDAMDALDDEAAGEPQPLEKFVPPPPPPLPRLSRQTVLGTIAVVVGLLMVVTRPESLPFDRSATMLLGFAAMLGGASALISRLRPGSDPDDSHPDDGAKV